MLQGYATKHEKNSKELFREDEFCTKTSKESMMKSIYSNGGLIKHI